MKKEDTSSVTARVLVYAFMLFLTSVVFCFRAVSSIAIALILVLGVLGNRSWKSLPRTSKSFLLFLLSCTLLFLLECVSFFYTTNRLEQWSLLQRSSGLVFIPLAVLSSSPLLTKERLQKIIGSFTIILSLGSLYCLIATVIKFCSGAPSSVFFYHELVKPLSQHAIQFSILTFIGLVWLIENPAQKSTFYAPRLARLIIPFLSIFLLLLSSKLIITLYILYLFYFFLHNQVYQLRKWPVYIIFLALTTVLITTKNPVGNRFRAIVSGNTMLFEQQVFSPGIYFNGVQFRLLQWRFTSMILTEQNAWIFGLTPGDAQSYLDRKYTEVHMFTGVPGTQKRGFLGYHTHNQFLQSLLENGVLALLTFILICFSLLVMAKQIKSTVLNWLVALLIIYCFTDAPFKTQYGIVIFTFFPSLIFVASRSIEAVSGRRGRIKFAESTKQPH
jgi:O-antigen ligase